MPAEILQNKHLSTRFQILVEIASFQSGFQQKDIAMKLGITPQAVSEHIKQLVRDGLLSSSRRARLKINPKGIDWMIRQLNDVQVYFKEVERVIWNIRISAAVADADLEKGQKIGLVMRNGTLLAVDDPTCSATGTTTAGAHRGEAVGIMDIHGIIDMDAGRVTILEIPGVRKGTLGKGDLARLKDILKEKSPVAYLGIEATAALNTLGIEPDIHFASKEAMVDATLRGISPFIVCVDEELPSLIKYLEDADVLYQLRSFGTES